MQNLRKTQDYLFKNNCNDLLINTYERATYSNLNKQIEVEIYKSKLILNMYILNIHI